MGLSSPPPFLCLQVCLHAFLAQLGTLTTFLWHFAPVYVVDYYHHLPPSPSYPFSVRGWMVGFADFKRHSNQHGIIFRYECRDRRSRPRHIAPKHPHWDLFLGVKQARDLYCFLAPISSTISSPVVGSAFSVSRRDNEGSSRATQRRRRCVRQCPCGAVAAAA